METQKDNQDGAPTAVAGVHFAAGGHVDFVVVSFGCTFGGDNRLKSHDRL